MEPGEQLSVIIPALCDVVDGIQPDQLGDPTPCAAFDVADVLDHMMVGGGTFAYHFRGEQPPEVQPAPRDGQVPAPLFRKTMEDLLDAVGSPGAAERTIVSPFGEMPGGTFARLLAFDGLIHGWDLATATDQPYKIPPDVVAAVDEFARAALTANFRDGDTFKDPTEVPAEADPLESLVAFSGRSL